MIILVCHFTKE